jgi:predicted kinase
MPRPTLVIIQGAPAAGKSTLRKKLAADLDIPCLSKDEIKEFLFENLELSDRQFSRTQGKASSVMLSSFAHAMLTDGQSVLIESAFYSEFAKPELKKIGESTNAKIIEFFCHVDENIRKDRFKNRAKDGSRHPGHMDDATGELIDPSTYSVLSIGEVIDVDTTNNISDTQYNHILATVRQYLTEEGNNI